MVPQQSNAKPLVSVGSDAPWPSAPPGSAMQQFFDLLREGGCSYDGWDGDGGDFTAPCHDDQHPSLHVEVGDKQAVVAVCRADGTTLPGILDALAARKAPVVGGKSLAPVSPQLTGFRVERDEVDWGDEPASQKARQRAKQGELGHYLDTVLYDYLTPAGEPIRRVTRSNYAHGKVIGQLHPWTSPTGFQTWLGGVEGVPITPWCWEDFAGWQAKGKRGLYITEGEKAADALIEAGYAATTYPGGAGAPLPTVEEMREHFTGFKSFRVWADADEPGVRRAFKLARQLKKAFPKATVRVVLNDVLFLGSKGADAADVDAAVRDRKHSASPGCQITGSEKEALAVIGEREETEESSSSAPKIEVAVEDFADIEMQAVEWFWEPEEGGLVAHGELCVLAGRQSDGKSTLSYAIAADATRGRLPGCFKGTPINVLVVNAEESAETTVKPRLVAAGADLKRVKRITITSPEGRIRQVGLA